MNSEREGGVKCFMRICSTEIPTVGKPVRKHTTDTFDTWHVVWVQPSIIECVNKDPVVWTQPSSKEGSISRLRYGRNHPIKWVMQWDTIIQKIRNLDFIWQNPGSCAPSQPKQSTNSSMQIDELKSNMQEHHLITSQWWDLLTDMRDTTSNGSGSQGTKIQSTTCE